MILKCSFTDFPAIISEQFERNQSSINLFPVDFDIEVDDIKIKVVLQTDKRDIKINLCSVDQRFEILFQKTLQRYQQAYSRLSVGFCFKKFTLRQFTAIDSMYKVINSETDLSKIDRHFPIRGHYVKISERVGERALGPLRKFFILHS